MNLLEYVEENESSIEETGYSEIDTMVLTQFMLMNLGDVAPEMNTGETMSLEELCIAIKNSGTNTTLTDNQKKLIEAVQNSPRFRDMQVSNYIENPAKNSIAGFQKLNDHKVDTEQFAAMVITMDTADGPVNCVVCQATEPLTADGWVEDFSMIYTNRSQSQQDSIDYINQVVPQMEGDFIGAAHSKGENDQFYGLLFCDREVFERFIVVYGYDGPGMAKGVTTAPRYNEVVELYEKYVPQESIVGLLLNEQKSERYVHSNGISLGQHSVFTWEIEAQTDGEGNVSYSFVEDKQTIVSIIINDYLDTLVSHMNSEQRGDLYLFAFCVLHTVFPEEDEQRYQYALCALACVDIKGAAQVLGLVFADYCMRAGTTIIAIEGILKAIAVISVDRLEEFFENIIMYTRQYISELVNYTTHITYAEKNTRIVVDTEKMYADVEALEQVKKRLASIEQDLRQVYSQGEAGSLNITCQQMVGQLQKCIDWLKETALDFDSIERELVKI